MTSHPKMTGLILWVAAVLIAGFYVAYENDPYDPLKGELELADGQTVEYELVRSVVLDEPLQIAIDAPEGVSGYVEYWRVNSDDEPKTADMEFQAIEVKSMGNTETVERLATELPGLSEMAGKYAYFIHLDYEGQEYVIDDGKGGAVIPRYRGDVPMLTVVLPHVVFIMLSMVLGIRAAFEALRPGGKPVWMMWATLGTLILGGFVFGPIMQNHAFGVYWAGVPMGWDLTDNKVTIELVLWLVAVFFNTGSRKGGKWSNRTIAIAGIATFIIYMIPHSLFGSGFDYKAGSAVTE
ncbi:MAG: hypothetical protein JXE06_05645 [Coriobacteriia bacterium]|nr:hypothetical protein [Coriobacteriia bacterium]MBN2822809.1 hypothetical protein [Coriobacteriia bacterium]